MRTNKCLGVWIQICVSGYMAPPQVCHSAHQELCVCVCAPRSVCVCLGMKAGCVRACLKGLAVGGCVWVKTCVCTGLNSHACDGECLWVSFHVSTCRGTE